MDSFTTEPMYRPKTYEELAAENAILRRKNRNRKLSLHKLQEAYDRLVNDYGRQSIALQAERNSKVCYIPWPSVGPIAHF